MIEQLKTIREDAEWINNCNTGGMLQGRARNILEALTQLEAMVGEPYGTVTVVRNPLCVDMHYFYRHPEPPYLDNAAECHTVYTAALVAQQPQARPDFTDEWTGYLKDGETPFERFLRERKDMQSVLKLYQRALEENERLKTQQPQAEPFGYVSQHTNGTWEFSPTPAGVYPDTAKSITAVYAKQPQAEAVDWKAQYEHQKRRAERWIAKYEADIGPLEKAGPVAQQPQEIEVQCPVCNHKFYEWPNDKQPQAEAVPVVDRVYEAAKRLVDHADFQLGGVLSAKSKARDIPSNAASKVKARHLASLRDALAKTPQQAEAVPPGYALVPVEPTEEMLKAAAKACDDRMYPADMRHGPRAQNADRYHAMIEAAQKGRTA